MLRRILLALIGVMTLAIVAFALYVASRQHLTFQAPFPPVTASADSSVIVRGRYIVRAVAGCSACHGDPKQAAAQARGEDIPLSGGFEWDIPPGKFYARNITPDAETGIGRASDGAIARALRYGVGPDGRALLPFMEMQGLSDQDLVAVVSYLRTQPPVRNRVPMHKYNLLGMAVRATVLANPVGPKTEPPKASPEGATVENGRYLCESVANCWACHTERDERTGALTGARYAGARGSMRDTSGRAWSPPNITSAHVTGRLARFSEDDFVARFRAGQVLPGSPMPWQIFQRMKEDDVRAIYRFLMTVPPVEDDVGPPVVEKPAKR